MTAPNPEIPTPDQADDNANEDTEAGPDTRGEEVAR